MLKLHLDTRKKTQLATGLLIACAGLSAGLAYAAKPGAAWQAEKVTLRFETVDAAKMLQVAADMGGVKLSGLEQLKGNIVTLKKRDVALGAVVSTVLGCHGYALVEAEGGYAVQKTAEANADMAACIDAGLPNT